MARVRNTNQYRTNKTESRSNWSNHKDIDSSILDKRRIMNIELFFEITINGISKDLVVSKIDKMGYQFLPYNVHELDKDIEPDKFSCRTLISEEDAFDQLVLKIASLYQLNGIQTVKIMHTSKIEEEIEENLPDLDSSTSSQVNKTGFMNIFRSFVDHWIFPVIMSALAYAIITTNTVHRLKPNANAEDFIWSVLFPTIVSLITYIGTRKSVEHALRRE